MNRIMHRETCKIYTFCLLTCSQDVKIFCDVIAYGQGLNFDKLSMNELTA